MVSMSSPGGPQRPQAQEQTVVSRPAYSQVVHNGGTASPGGGDFVIYPTSGDSFNGSFYFADEGETIPQIRSIAGRDITNTT